MLRRTILFVLTVCTAGAAQTLRTTQPTNYLREGPASYFQIIASLPASSEVNKILQQGSWVKVKTDQNDQGWLSENSFAAKSGNGSRNENIIKGKTSSRASRAELAAAVKGFGKKYVEGTGENAAPISKYEEPVVTPEAMEQFERSFSVEPFRGYMEVERPFDIRFHEEGIGLGIAQKIAAQKGLVEDRTALQYINKIGNRIARYTKAYDLGFRFYILKDDHAGAFAVPGGYIFITRGMLRDCTNEAELAAVIAHEMVHVVQRHGVKEMKKSVAKVRAESAFDELEADTGPMGDEEKELEEYADGVYQSLIAPRLLEYEVKADELAMVYLKRAGYDPTALVAVLKRIHEPAEASQDIFDDRYMKKDDMTERIHTAQRTVREEGYKSRAERQFADRFNSNTAGIR
jgi:hypothetical protein